MFIKKTHLTRPKWSLRKQLEPLENCCLRSFYDMSFSLLIWCLFCPRNYVKYWAIFRKRYPEIFFTVMSVTSFLSPAWNNQIALSKNQPNRKCLWYFAKVKVSGRNQRSRSLNCSALFKKWKSVTPTARLIYVFISYGKYIILDEHLELCSVLLHPNCQAHIQMGTKY